MVKKQHRASPQWRVMDVHIHTPASSDYQQPDVSYIEILQKAEARGVDIIAFADHNTVAGYRRMTDEIQQLTLLEKLNRLIPEERSLLSEYRRLMEKVLVLPGVEISATFGFHVLGIFSPDIPVREIEHMLLNMNIPSYQLDEGSATVGATTDVLNVYRLLNQAGALVIAAHANSTNGVAMRGFNFGGQTKIAYTQDNNLHALEVTDLEQLGGRTTAAFFNGTKPEYPRRMHCIQGSDAHRLTTDPLRKKNLGVGDRTTDILLDEVTFTAIKEVFQSNDFSQTRPHRHKEEPVYDFLLAALDQGPDITQDFHESITIRGGKLYAVIADICAFANTNGGTLYIGLSTDQRKPPVGVPEVEQTVLTLEKEINSRISPLFQCSIDIHEYKGKKIIRILVPRGSDPPYAVDDNKIYIRNEAETGLAVRDEIVDLVLRRAQSKSQPEPSIQVTSEVAQDRVTKAKPRDLKEDVSPRTGVEVLPPEDRNGTKYFTMRDLRNGNMVKNVTRSSARRLWHYAIQRYLEVAPLQEKSIQTWHGNFGLLHHYRQGKNSLFDLVQKTPTGLRYFFGVTEDGIHGPWKVFTGEDESLI